MLKHNYNNFTNSLSLSVTALSLCSLLVSTVAASFSRLQWSTTSGVQNGNCPF